MGLKVIAGPPLRGAIRWPSPLRHPWPISASHRNCTSAMRTWAISRLAAALPPHQRRHRRGLAAAAAAGRASARACPRAAVFLTMASATSGGEGGGVSLVRIINPSCRAYPSYRGGGRPIQPTRPAPPTSHPPLLSPPLCTQPNHSLSPPAAQEDFDKAADEAKGLPDNTSDDDKLALYALFKVRAFFRV